MNVITKATLSLFAGVLVGASADASVDVSQLTDAQLSSAIAQILTPQVRVANEDAYVFHYDHSSDAAPNAESAVVRKNLEASIATFWNTAAGDGGEDSLFGNGLYAAFDPLSTQRYGRPNFNLFMIQIKSGLRVIDIGAEEFTGPVLAELVARGCDQSSMSVKPDYVALLSNASEQCRAIGLGALKELRVQILSYDYTTYLFETCKSRTEILSRAFVILSPEAIATFKVFGPKSEPTDDMAAIQKLSSDFVLPPVLRRSPPLWPALTSATTEDAKAWAHQYLINCR